MQMRNRFLGAGVVAVLVGMAMAGTRVPAADSYMVDPYHSGVTFKITHMGLASVPGRFNDYSGDFTIDAGDASKCSFNLTIKVSSIDTNNKKRDEHLRSPDFFNAKQFPTISFKSTAVKVTKGGYQVTGNLTLRGETKPVTFTLLGGKKAEFPKGVQRTGYTTDLTIKRSDFGMTKFGEPMLGDEVAISISFEGTRKK
jgi:polyisoprenoid-binding protein YceI